VVIKNSVMHIMLLILYFHLPTRLEIRNGLRFSPVYAAQSAPAP